ncbi:hypothetical protein K501DRAFT_304718 [Backusella circina FSU 941]|nr:hypothetical protein K501DRAFT_304718 [Backusella circina FSU 941]
MERSLPNKLVNSTPGTGKTISSEMIVDALDLQHVNVGELVREKKFCKDYLEDLGKHVLDEYKFGLVLILRAHRSYLYDCMVKRGYNKNKIDGSMECEIMQIILEIAKESYTPKIVIELPSNTVDDAKINIERYKQ